MSLELWAGPECTVNRVGDRYFDQVRRSGHHDRPEDLNLFVELGITKLRYPVLWERVEQPNGELDWTWTDQRLQRLRHLKVVPIAGLLHHGSGPLRTSLIDPDFPQKFSQYARSVAERYPWIENYTPINEPLTTARFSGLYAHWYPHGKTDRIFLSALLHQCRAIVLAMREIRKVNPDARLIQTEDLGKSFSTLGLSYQANFDNERRWLTFDLLCGRIRPGQPMWRYCLSSGVADHELQWFAENPCSPDILGVNHYVTSDRYLDENLDRYPSSTHGGNSQHRYADVEAVRVEGPMALGPGPRLLEIWNRYRRPVAVTEAHIGCSVDEQMRWFHQVWTACQRLREGGADIQAVTAWALLGSFDWNCLLVCNDNVYEPGVFHVRDGQPKRTALAGMLRELALGERPSDARVHQPGWWQRPERIFYRAEEFIPMDMPQSSSAAFASQF